MKKKERKRCKNTESRLKKCKYDCEEKPTGPVPEPTGKPCPAPTGEPGPEPTVSPDPTRLADKIVQKCRLEPVQFVKSDADIFTRVLAVCIVSDEGSVNNYARLPV